MVGPLDMDEEADQDESDQEELVQQQVWRHEDVPSHDGERRRLYRISPLANDPLVAGTPPAVPPMYRAMPLVPEPVFVCFVSFRCHAGVGQAGH
jgi:hypothetical protein